MIPHRATLVIAPYGVVCPGQSLVKRNKNFRAHRDGEQDFDGRATVARPRAQASPPRGRLPQITSMWFSITPHSANTESVSATQTLLTSLHQAYRGTEPIELVIEGHTAGTRLLAKLPDGLHSLFRSNAADLLPDCRVEPCMVEPREKAIRTIATIRLVPECFAIGRDEGGEITDAVAPVLSALRTGRAGAIDARLRFDIRPASSSRRKRMETMVARLGYRMRSDWLNKRYIHLVHSRSLALEWLSEFVRRILLAKRRTIQLSESKIASHLYECLLTVEVGGPASAERLVESKLADIIGSLGAFTSDVAQFQVAAIDQKLRSRWRYSSLFSSNEISQVWHPPGQTRIADIARSPIVELEPPNLIGGANDGVVLGRVVYRRQKEPVVLTADSRMRHAFIIGRTGCGKSTLIHNMIVSDMRSGRGVLVLDPHGDLVDTLLDFVPTRRTNSVLYLDAGDRDFPIGFNPLATGGRLDPVLVADGVITAFSQVFGMEAANAPRLLYIFKNCLLALISDRDEFNLIGVQRMLTDDAFRKTIVARIQNPAVRQFWQGEFARWRPTDRTAFVASLQNKLGGYLSNPLLAGILGQTRNGLDMRHLMDSRSIVLINLSKGRMGSDASSLLGSLIVSSLQTAALSRAAVPESERAEFFVYLDEFSTFVSEGNDTFATILSESRKYRTGYTLVTQFVQQLDRQTRSAVFGNCGSLVAMQCGIDDARVMAEQLGENVTPQMVAKLPRYHAYSRLMMDGAPTRPFAIQTLPPPKRTQNRADVVRRVSQSAFGCPRKEVETQIAKAYAN